MAWFLLLAYHGLLFRRFYFQNPYAYASSELLEQGFSSFLHLGRERRAGHWVPHDPYYYPDYASLPFLSSFYPPHAVAAWLATFLPLNQAWMLYCLTMVCHCGLSSVGMYILLASVLSLTSLSAGVAAVTLSSLGYAMKQNSSIIYTTSWVPVFILSALSHHTSLTGISLGMMLLAGYWPIALMAVPLGCLAWLLG